MKKATLVLATFVAFLLSGNVFAARVYPTMPPIKDVLGGTATIVGDGIKVTGPGSLFSQEFIPAPISKPLAVVAETSIASSSIAGLAKRFVKGGVGAIVAGVVIDEMLDGVDWLIKDGSVVKPIDGAASPTDPTKGQYYWSIGGVSTKFSSAQAACNKAIGGATTSVSLSIYSATVGICTSYTATGEVYATQNVIRSGSSCPVGTTYNVAVGACTGAATYAPLSDTDLTVLDGFIKGKDGTWQRDLTTEICASSESCYQSLAPTTQLNGPATVSGTPQTVTTTSPTGSVSTSTKTPTATITYGPNYYDTTTTTTTNNSDGSSSTDTKDPTLPPPPNIFGGANDGLKGINDGIPGTTSSTSPIPYMAWWSFSQSCSEITFVLPVSGSVSTAFCPIYKQYIWPILYFFFAVFTWHHCFQVWRNTVMRVRAY